MSGVMWCDPGGHAFSVLEEGWQQFTVSQSKRDGLTMRSETQQMDACSRHSMLASMPNFTDERTLEGRVEKDTTP